MRTDEQLWAAFQSVYETGSRMPFDPVQSPDIVEALRAVAVFAVDMAEEALVRRDQFSARTLEILDDLHASIESGLHETDLTAPDPEAPNSGEGE